MENTMSDSQFNASSTAAEVLADVDLSGRRAVVTGASSGIGAETVRALAAAGADVTMAVRNVEAGTALADELRAGFDDGAGNLQVAQLDLADLGSVRAFAAAWSGPLHMLINNAGVMALPTLTRSVEGWEAQFATNHLGHFALAQQLHAALAAAGDARVVSVASIGHLFSPVVFDDPHYLFRPYDPWTSYGQSKCANVLFAVAAAQRWAADGITANAVMPGNVGETALARHVTPEVLAPILSGPGRLALPAPKSVAQGAATSVLVAASPVVEGTSGRYFEDCAEAAVVPDRGERIAGVAPYALDPDNAQRLWELSAKLLNLPG
jgi:NAD(P)-dependent dehydrogenase (short-subunit alcohol dehydrogenase family)